MSALSEKLDALEAAIDSEAAQGQANAENIATLTAKVAELQALVDAGTATPEDIARLDALTAKIAEINPD